MTFKDSLLLPALFLCHRCLPGMHTHTHRVRNIHAQSHIHTHTHKYILYTFTHTHKHTFSHTHTQSQKHTQTHIHTHTQIHSTHIHTHTNTHSHTHTPTHHLLNKSSLSSHNIVLRIWTLRHHQSVVAPSFCSISSVMQLSCWIVNYLFVCPFSSKQKSLKE